MRAKADRQGMLLQHFKSCWKKEYLTALQAFHHTAGANEQTVNSGDVQTHDDTPRNKWKLAVIKNLSEATMATFDLSLFILQVTELIDQLLVYTHWRCQRISVQQAMELNC